MHRLYKQSASEDVGGQIKKCFFENFVYYV